MSEDSADTLTYDEKGCLKHKHTLARSRTRTNCRPAMS